jgi:hypothetical protein
MRVICCIITLLTIPAILSGSIQFSNYFENRFFILSSGLPVLQETHKEASLSDYTRLRIQASKELETNASVHFALDFFTFHGLLRSPLGAYESQQTNQDKRLLLAIDRAHINFYLPGFDIILGKQRLAEGVASVWTSLDIFNRINIFEPTEEKPGINALKIYVPLGKLSALTGIYAIEDDFTSSKSSIRAQTQFARIDAAFTFSHEAKRNQSLLGVDFRGENLIGWWAEAGYFISPHRTNQKIVLGFDYTFPVGRGLYWMTEFLYDQSGEKESSRYDYDKLQSGERYTLGRSYCYSKVSYGMLRYFSASIAYIGNWTDGSFILNPSVLFPLSESVSLNTGFFIPMGNEGGEMNRLESGLLFFLWLKINF